jgi:hypothetical protein
MDATASPTYPHGFEVSLGGESTMRGVARFGTSQGSPQRAAAVVRVSCKLRARAFDQGRSRKGVGELRRPGRQRGQAVQGGAQ